MSVEIAHLVFSQHRLLTKKPVVYDGFILAKLVQFVDKPISAKHIRLWNLINSVPYEVETPFTIAKLASKSLDRGSM